MSGRRWTCLVSIALLFTAGCGSPIALSQSDTVQVVAAENFYGDLARQIGGKYVTVASVLNNPNADPHEFETSSRDAIRVSIARLVVVNGLGYDSWMQHLLDAAPTSGRRVIIAGELAGLRTGANPHVWYNLGVVRKVAHAIAADLIGLDPSHRAAYTRGEARLQGSLRRLQASIDRIRAADSGIPVAETEPVFGYMLRSLGLKVSVGAFQHAIEEGTDPPPQAVAAFEATLHAHRVRALLYNSQAREPVTVTVAAIARAEGIPVIGVTETEPAGKDYQRWMLDEIQSVAKAVAA